MMSHQNKTRLYIQQQDNILDGITLKEPFERNVLLQLVDSDLLRKHLTTRMLEDTPDREKQLKYLGLQNNGKAVITYKRRKNKPFGRCDPAKALGLYRLDGKYGTLAENWER
jgi:hypothetical protein